MLLKKRNVIVYCIWVWGPQSFFRAFREEVPVGILILLLFLHAISIVGVVRI